MTETRPRWVHLTPEQREIAADLYARAMELTAHGMTIAEAMDAAAIQAGHIPHLFAITTDEES